MKNNKYSSYTDYAILGKKDGKVEIIAHTRKPQELVDEILKKGEYTRSQLNVIQLPETHSS